MRGRSIIGLASIGTLGDGTMLCVKVAIEATLDE
jgi:hypothetical protein